MTYSIIVPLILPFATLYFGLAYLVYKYRFLFVFCVSPLSLLALSLRCAKSLTSITLQIARTRAEVRPGRWPSTGSGSASSSSRSSCSVRTPSSAPSPSLVSSS